MPREMIEADRKGYKETSEDKPSQSVEDIMRIIQEAMTPGIKTKGGTGSSVVGEVEEEVGVSGDYVKLV